MKVLYFSPLPPPAGGMETWTELLLDVGLGDGYSVRVIDTRSPLHDADEGLQLGKVRFGLRLLAQCRAACARGDVGLVHVNCSFFRWSALRDLQLLRIAKRRGLPVVVHLHGGLGPGRWASFPRLARWLYRQMLEEADVVITLSDEVSDELVRAGVRARRLLKLPNFLPADWRPPAVADAQRRDVLFTGKVASHKGLAALVAIARALPDVTFHWVGRQVDAVEPPPNVCWHPEVSPERMRAFYADKRVFLFPSRIEGFPISLLEAMAAGLPVVGSNVGAIPEMAVHDQGGLLHDRDDVAGMTASLKALLDDPARARRMGEWNRARVDREYRAGHVLARLREIYRELVAGRGVARVAGSRGRGASSSA